MPKREQWRAMQRVLHPKKKVLDLDSEERCGFGQGTPAMNVMVVMEDVMKRWDKIDKLVRDAVGDEKGRAGRAMPDYGALMGSPDWQSHESSQRREEIARFMEKVVRCAEVLTRLRRGRVC